MIAILDCITTEHDRTLLVVSIVVCLAGSATTFALWSHLRVLDARARRPWLALTSVTAACSVWATHFIAMMAHVYDIQQGLSLTWTVLSLVIAVCLSAVAVQAVTGAGRAPGRIIAAGVHLTVAVAGMHFAGMSAYRVNAVITWDPAYVALAVGTALVLNVTAVALFGSAPGPLRTIGTPVAYAFGIVALHFIGMTAVTLAPLGLDVRAWIVPTAALAPSIAVTIVFIAAAALIAVVVDRQRLRARAEDADRLAQLARDLTAAREVADEANAAKSRFLAAMSHEIRTPLNGVIGMAEILSVSTLTDEQRDCVATITSSGTALLEIIDDVLDLAKIEAARVDLVEDGFDLLTTLEDVLALLGYAAEKKGLKLHLRHRPDAPRQVTGDAGRVRQIVLNLVGNAIKFTHRGHVLVDVAAGSDPDRVTISVTDTGIGVASSKLRTIFAAFAQADQTTTRNYGGTGLGLTISRSLAELMGGGITADSTEGIGTVFRADLRLPRQAMPPRVVPDRPGPVLVVSPDAVERSIHAETIRGLGAEAVEAAALDEALDLHRARPATAMVLCCGAEVPVVDIALPVLFVTPATHSRATSRCHRVMTRPLRRDRLAEWLDRPDAAETPTDADPGRTAAIPATPARHRALVVDDSSINRRVLCKMLPPGLFAVEEAMDGAAAVAACAGKSFDIVFMDVSMPVMDGLEATRAIRRTEAERGGFPIRIIAVTAHASADVALDCTDAGMDEVLVKPIRRQPLLDLLQRRLDLIEPLVRTG